MLIQRARRKAFAFPPIEWPDRKNDKVLGVPGANVASVRDVIADFAHCYDAPDFLERGVVLETARYGGTTIRFPRDIPADILVYFVNYLRYPIDRSGFDDPHACCTMDDGFAKLGSPRLGSKGVIYVSESSDYDAVRLLFPDNEAWEFSFRVGGAWSKVAHESRRYGDFWIVNA